MASASSWMAARTMSATLRLWPEVHDFGTVRLQQAADHVDRSVVTVEERRRADEAQRLYLAASGRFLAHSRARVLTLPMSPPPRASRGTMPRFVTVE